MTEATHDQVISEVKTLNLSDQLRLLEETATLIRRRTNMPLPRRILELKGKGKSIWKGLNVKSYIDEERSSWDG